MTNILQSTLVVPNFIHFITPLAIRSVGTNNCEFSFKKKKEKKIIDIYISREILSMLV